MNRLKLVFFVSSVVLTLIFFFLPHTIELTGTLETWFPYKGLALYKDISMFHFPIGRFVLVPLHLLSNWNLELDPFVGLIMGILSLYVIYLFGKKYLSRLATVFSMVFCVTFFWYFATAILYFHEMLIGLLLALALLLYFDIRKAKVISTQKIFVLGLILSLAEFSGQVASITVGVFVLIIIRHIFAKTARANAKILIIRFISGLLTPLALLTLYFISQNALLEFFYWNTIYYFTYSGFRNTPFSDLPWREIIAFYIPLIALGFTQISEKRISKNSIVALLGLTTIPFIIFSIFHFHHMNYTLPLMALVAGIALDSAKSPKHKFIFILGFIIFILPIVSWHISRLNPIPSMKIVNDVYPGDPMYLAVQWVKLHTNPEDKLMVFGDPLFYMRADRLPASRPAKSIPYSWEPLEKVSQEIKASPPDYWIIDTRSMKTIKEVYKKPAMTDFVEKELSENYTKSATFDIWEIWVYSSSE